ncbi:MAG: hypothetical protein AAF478_08630 [Pseudomonadota bacterium]
MSAVQLLVKHRFNVAHGEMPLTAGGLPVFIFQALKDPYLWLAGAMLITAAIIWYAVISRMSLGVAFTFAALSYPAVMAGSYVFLSESFAIPQILGCGLIVVGLVLIAAFN